MSFSKVFAFACLCLLGAAVLHHHFKNNLPVVAIANYGAHSSLSKSIEGLKAELARQGYIEGETITFIESHVNFEQNMIPLMLQELKTHRPAVIVTLTTPVSQYAKNTINDIPLVFSVITDPVEAGLLKSKDHSFNNVTGASDQQDLSLMIELAKSLLVNPKKIGVLYSTSEANDQSLVTMLETAASKHNMEVLSVPIEHMKDIPLRMHLFKDKVDMIYVGTSGPIQPAMAAITYEADKMNIPIFNVEEQAVLDGLALASYAVDYTQVGTNSAMLVSKILNNEAMEDLTPIFPSQQDHQLFISKKKAQSLNILIPNNYQNKAV